MRSAGQCPHGVRWFNCSLRRCIGWTSWCHSNVYRSKLQLYILWIYATTYPVSFLEMVRNIKYDAVRLYLKQWSSVEFHGTARVVEYVVIVGLRLSLKSLHFTVTHLNAYYFWKVSIQRRVSFIVPYYNLRTWYNTMLWNQLRVDMFPWSTLAKAGAYSQLLWFHRFCLYHS